MKNPVLSIHNPWAWLIATGRKDVENRGKCLPCLVGKWVLIHSTVKAAKDHFNMVERWTAQRFPHIMIPHREGLPYGCLIGRMHISGIVNQATATSPWFIGPEAYTIDNVEQFEPIRCTGKQGLWYTDLAQAEPQLDTGHETAILPDR